MTKVPVWDKSSWPSPIRKNNNGKKWKAMNREVKPREKEVAVRLLQIHETIGILKRESRVLREELALVRGVSTFGQNTVKLYALRLQNNCWYIGMTYDVERRFAKHSKGKGANWTKLYKPIEISETRDTKLYSQAEVGKLEDDMTLEYALKYGSDKVRGGGWCQTKPHWPDVIRQNEL